MNKNNFFEKVGKLTFSVLLTGILVSTAVFAVNVVRNDFADGEILSAVDLNTIQPAIDSKVSKTEFPTCAVGESLTYDGINFSCTSPAETSMPESVQAGMVYNNTFDNKTVNVTFSSAFSGIPKVVVAMNGFYLENSSRGEKFELYPSVSNVSSTGFKLLIPGNTRNNHKLKAASVTWIAIPPTGSWSSPSTSSYSGGCGNKRTINNEKNGSCLVGLTNTYYTGETTCNYTETRMGRSGEPIIIPRSGYNYSSKKTQSCN